MHCLQQEAKVHKTHLPGQPTKQELSWLVPDTEHFSDVNLESQFIQRH